MDPCQHVTKNINIDQPKVRRMAGHGAQQQVLVECVGNGQIVRSMKSSISIIGSIQQFGLLPHQTDAIQRNCRPSPCSRRARAPHFRTAILTKKQPPSPAPTALQRKGQRSSLRCAQRRRATELRPHRLASRNSTLSVTWDEKQRAYRRRTQCERSYTSTDNVVFADGGRALELILVAELDKLRRCVEEMWVRKRKVTCC